MPDESTPQSTQPIERRLATILCADVASYSKMMAANEERTVNVFRGHREIFESMVNQHRGRIFNTAGDALLVEFNSPVEAVRCATDIQSALRTRNEHLAPEEKMQFRMGINLGDVIIQGGDLLGDGVNVAARIQAATTPGGICISGSVHDQIQNKLSLDFKLLGEQTYKNIPKPIRTYTINEGSVAVTPARQKGWRVPVAVIAAVLAIAGAGYWGYGQYDANRTEQRQVEARLAAQMAAQKQAAEQAQQAAEQAKRDLQMQAQKQAAEEELRRAQEERNRVEQDRKLLEAEKRAADEAKRKAADDALRRAQEERTQLEQDRKQLKAEKAAAEAANKQAADEAQHRAQDERTQLEQTKRNAAEKHQSAGADTKQATTSQQAAPAAATKDTPKPGASHDGTYSGRVCNHFTFPGDKVPACWPLALVVRNGIAEGSWINRAMKPCKAYGTFGEDGSVQLNLAGWTLNGLPARAVLLGRFVDNAFSASGQWRIGHEVSGNWQRMP
jgi:class 3 adenylate cyclase